jgi:hypothetical protein
VAKFTVRKRQLMMSEINTDKEITADDTPS